MSDLGFFSESVDRWGAAEWFDRLAKAIREQDKAVVAGNDIGMLTYQNIAASSAMRLVRDYEANVRAALSNSDAKDREIAELRLQDEGTAARALVYAEQCAAAETTISSLISKLEEAEKALEPFAGYETADGDGLDDELFRSPDEHPLLGNGLGDNWTPAVTVGDFRRARTTLSSLRSK